MKLRTIIVALIVSAGFAAPARAAVPHPLVYLSSSSTNVTQAQVDAAVPAFQTAVSRDLAPTWGTDATLTTDPALAASADMSVIVSDGANCFCFGYHDLIGGKPVAYVDAAAAVSAHDDWRLTASHELFEMLVDPWLNRLATFKSRTWLVEVCDPPEDGFYAYWIDGVPISDFITPAWYGVVRGKPVDFTHRLKRPGQIGRHGYASFLDPSQPGGWGQVFA